MKIFKNYKSKRKLRKELAFYKEIHKPIFPITQVEKNIISVSSVCKIDYEIPTEYYKGIITHNIAEKLEKLIKYDVVERKDFACYEIKGTIKIVV